MTSSRQKSPIANPACLPASPTENRTSIPPKIDSSSPTQLTHRKSRSRPSESHPPATHGVPASPGSLFSGSVWVHHDQPSLSLSIMFSLSLSLSLSLPTNLSSHLSQSLYSLKSHSLALSSLISLSHQCPGEKKEEEKKNGREKKRKRCVADREGDLDIIEELGYFFT
jgi:hypothetical protein